MVRVDDFPQTKGEPQHTLAAYRDFHRCLSEGIGGKRYLLGVIPGRCSPDDLVYLNQVDVVVGMHGTDHDEGRLDRNCGNQFEPYLTVKQIDQELRKYRSALETALGRPITVYMPPRNVVSFKSLQAAELAGFREFTSGPETAVYADASLPVWHSAPPHEYGRSDEMLHRGSVEYLRDAARKRDLVLTLHWTWETNVGLSHLRSFLDAIGRENFRDFPG